MKVRELLRGHAARTAALAVVALACLLLSEFLFVRPAAAALVVLLAAFSAYAVGGWAAAAAVVLPVALMTPWDRPTGAGREMVVFALAAAMLWGAWLLFERSRAGGRGAPAAALLTAVSCVLSPPSLLLGFVLVLFRAARPGGQRSLPALAATFIVPAVAAVVCLGVWDMLVGGLSAGWFFGRFSPAAGGLWNVPRWSQSAHGTPYNNVTVAFNRWFYWPLAPALAALIWRQRRRWWFAPTFLWGALLVAGSLAFGQGVYFQYSMPMQIGLLVPAGLAGAAELSPMFGVEKRRKRPYSTG